MLLAHKMDKWGVTFCLRLGFSLSLAARLSLALCQSRAQLYVCLFGLLPASGALGIPVRVVAVRTVTVEATRGVALVVCVFVVGVVIK